MRESLFSNQAVQPYLNKEFPLFKEAHEDRLFKHMTFFEDNPDIKLRVLAIDQNYMQHEGQTLNLRTIPTNIPIADPQAEKFRIKAVLSKEEYGITESYWVTEKQLEEDIASTHNQFRVRGVSDKNWRSDWVYSELRDFDNDLIVYNMIYDVLDLMLTVHDDQIDYLMDYIVSDTFAQIIQERMPQYATSLDFDEFQLTDIQEFVKTFSMRQDTNPREFLSAQLGEQFLVLADELKREFKETVTSSPKEFSELYRMYKLVDQFQTKQTDFVQLLLEIFLEEKFEKIVTNTNIEVLLQNSEETGIYLNSNYEFDIKAELIGAIYDASPDDHFVTSLNDAVQLISEPVFFEAFDYYQKEEVAKFLRMALAELYVPMLAIDNHLLEVETELEDRHKQQLTSEVVEFSLIEDDSEIRHMIVADLIEAVIKGDLEPVEEYHIGLIDHILQFMNDSRKTLLIDYNFDEVIEVILHVGESFRQAYNKEFGHVHESKQVVSVDNVQSKWLQKNRSIKESYFATLEDSYSILNTEIFSSIREKKEVGFVDSVVSEYQSFKKAIHEVIHSAMSDRLTYRSNNKHHVISEALGSLTLDDATIKSITDLFILNEAHTVNMKDLVGSAYTMAALEWQEEKYVNEKEAYFNLFKHYLRHPNKFPILDKKLVELQHELRDYFQLDGHEAIHYAMGDMDEGWPLGVFRLGVNTLKGEVSNS